MSERSPVAGANGQDGVYLVATGVSHSVGDLVAEAFAAAGISDWERRAIIDPQLYRPADPRQLVGDPTKLRSIGWRPSVSFDKFVNIMVTAEIEKSLA